MSKKVKDINLINYYPYYKTSLKWYEDIEVCKMVDNIDFCYDIERLKRMYKYLSKNGFLFYIKYGNKLIGDVCLQFSGEIAIVISKDYQGIGIGTEVLKQIISIAKKNEYKKVYARIYDFNYKSIRLFEKFDFKKIGNELYELHL